MPRPQPLFHTLAALALALLLIFSISLRAQTPEWIWHPNQGKAPAENEVRFFRKTFSTEGVVARAELTATADNEMAASINGKWVTASTDWKNPTRTDVTKAVQTGENLIAIRAANHGGVAAMVARLELTFADGKKRVVVTDAEWLAGSVDQSGWDKPEFKTDGWAKVASLGQMGDEPWGDVFAPATATPAAALTVLPGFKVELLRSALPGEGSWICMTVDDWGRLIVSPQGDSQPLLRMTLSADGQVTKVEPIPAPIHQAMGLLYAHKSLYANAHGPKGTGLYRLIDANENDQFDADEVHLLKNFAGEGEHGYHGVVLGPDQMIYVMNGNHTKLPPGLSPDSPHKNFAEDMLLPRQWDAGGHAVGILAPGGHVLRTDPEGKEWSLVLAGFRNAYDLAFGPDGELFTFDSDMEWDWGMPWYKPTRINHCVSGGDYGWRSGTGNWPVWYPDSLPSTLDIGIGSPTGMKYGARAKFPPKYRKAMFVEDWAYGRILAVHLIPQGATYSGTFETIVRGKPLNLTGIEIGQDGAMYFITGGRGTQSGLYRVTWTGPEAPADEPSPEQVRTARAGAEARTLRYRLEAFHGKHDPAAIDFAWPHLNSDDRWIRYAARIAIEWQDTALWQDRALGETRPNASLTALLALARTGGKDVQDALLMSLGRLAGETLSEDQNLDALRVLELAFIRMGKPEETMREGVIETLSRLYPSPSERLNRELSQILIYLEAPDVVAKTLALLEAAPSLEEQNHYVFHLRTLKTGWTMAERTAYFHWLNRVRAGGAHPPELLQWFRDAGRDYSDGVSYGKFIVNFRKDAVATLTPAELAELRPIITGQAVAALPATTQRAVVKEWTLNDILPVLDQAGKGRSFTRGKAAFEAAQCLVCHRFKNEGGSVGPDLTAIGFRFSRRDIIESILLPSKVVSDQYQNTTFTLKDGDDVSGRLVDEDDKKVVVVTNALTGETTEIQKSKIASSAPGKLSPMPEGLVNILAQDEILDLLAYLESGGKADHPAFVP